MWATDWKEEVPADEAERFERYAAQLRDLQHARARGVAPDRALHAKGQAGLEAEFIVRPDLPEAARVGLFAQPRTYPAFVRYSNGVGVRQSDRKPDVRGIAVKLVGVDGKKIIPGMEAARTVDFLAIQSASTPFHNADEFVTFVMAARSPALMLPRLLGAFGFGAFGLIGKLLKGVSRPVPSLATSRYYSALPIKFGPYAVHFDLVPEAAADPAAKPGRTSDYLAEELTARLAQGPVVYDFRVQFFVDAARTPIEDASVEWTEAAAPFVPLGRLVLPKQDPSSPRGKKIAELVENMSFDPWHTTEDFRPLGNMMRARNHAYRLSTQERKAGPEPDGSELR